MQIEQERINNRLFYFKLLGLSDWGCALTLPEVVGVVKIPPVMPLPLAPYYVIGVSQWQSRTVTIVDLAAALCGISAKQLVWSSDSYHLVARMIVGTQFELVAWPIVRESGILLAPSLVPWINVPGNFMASMIRASFISDHGFLVILNLESLTTVAQAAAMLKER